MVGEAVSASLFLACRGGSSRHEFSIILHPQQNVKRKYCTNFGFRIPAILCNIYPKFLLTFLLTGFIISMSDEIRNGYIEYNYTGLTDLALGYFGEASTKKIKKYLDN